MLRKVAAAAVVRNPYAERDFVSDLDPTIEASAAIAAELGRLCQQTVNDTVESYGKAGVVGVDGEKEHVDAEGLQGSR